MPDILKNVTILDLTQNIAGPFCTQLLGDLGANVIKVERPRTGDDTRGWKRNSWNGISTSYLAVNRNKRSICIDITTAGGAALLRRLADKADVFVHSVRAGSLEARGLGFEDLKKTNPGLIHCAISAFGDIGPRAGEPGYDAMLQAFCGIMSVTGHPDRPPARVGVSLLDFGTGMWAFSGILAALLKRNETGQGSNVTTSLMETGVNFMTLFLSHYMAEGIVLGRTGDITQFSAPYESFVTSDGSVYVSAANNNMFRRTCEALGIPEVADDPRFQDLVVRAQTPNRFVLHDLIETKTKALTTAECVAVMRKAGAPCVPINAVDDIYRDEQVNAMGMIRSVPAEGVPDFKIVDLPVSIDGEKASVRLPPPALGRDTDWVLEWAGVSADEAQDLKGANAIA